MAMIRRLPLSSILVLAACSPAPSAGDEASADESSEAAEDEAEGADESESESESAGDDGGADGVGADMGTDLPDPTEIEMAMQSSFANAPAGVDGMTLVVHDENDERVLEVTVGEMPTDRRIPVASASKYVSALAIMRLIDEGLVDFDDTPGEVLGWTGPLAGATLNQLGAFVSGLPGDHLCTLNPLMTLDECAATFDALEPIGAPGEQFRYGSAHMATMGSMVQALTGEDWDTIFEQEIKGPLGIDSDEVRYYTVPADEGIGLQNPLLAGGLTISIDEYMPILSVLFHRGIFEGETFVDPSLMDRFFRNDYPDAGVNEATIGPYSFGSWLLCGQGVHECDSVTSPGAFGFTPWVVDSVGEPRYYAVLGMRSEGADGAIFSVLLTGELMPLISEYLEGL